MKKTLGVVGEPPRMLRTARLDNIALVPASLLLSKDVTYLPVARRLPTGSVLCVANSSKHEKIFMNIVSFFHTHGRQVLTLPIEKLARDIQKKPSIRAENLPLAF